MFIARLWPWICLSILGIYFYERHRLMFLFFIVL